jgi:formamidopyrimidine-DNA glycosylase
LAGTSGNTFRRWLVGSRFVGLTRRGKYLLFSLRRPRKAQPFQLVGHLGMTGRIYLADSNQPPPRHTAVLLGLGRQNFVFEDTRYFGRLTLNTAPLKSLGPEPLTDDFCPRRFRAALGRSSQPVKVKIMDQHLVAGVGNIYASEALFRARINPCKPARRLTEFETRRLWKAIRQVLADATERGSTIPLDFAGKRDADRLFYFGSSGAGTGPYTERLRVYDRAGQPCTRCRSPIRRVVQALRSTYYCPNCQR